jgi:putative DNA primase/helicase
MTAPKTARVADGMVRVAVEPDGIPDELKSYDHWIVWRARLREEGGDEFDKFLYNARTGEAASHSDSRTWSAFDDAVAAYVRDGWDGIGFVFSSGDPFTGIDLDKVRNPDTGELTEWARAVIEAFGGYAEVSPSGRGVHIYVKATAPSKKGKGIEIYSTKRFFTVTGVRP